MTSRTRARPRGAVSYTARLRRRPVPTRPASRWPAPLGARLLAVLPALLVLCAELAHLAAAVVEWPASPARGVFHVLAAAGLGLVIAGVWFGPARPQLVAGIALTLALAAAWPAGALLDLPPYQAYPVPAAIAVVAVEVAAAALLLVALRTAD